MFITQQEHLNFMLFAMFLSLLIPHRIKGLMKNEIINFFLGVKKN